MKRILDIVFGAIILIVTAPFILIILLIVFLAIHENPIFQQQRALSFKSARVRIFKIRTLKKQLNNIESEKNQNVFIKKGLDNKMPLICRLLRKTGLDEIMQLINVVKGEMALIGPRPLTIDDLIIIEKENKTLYDRRSLISSMPGITGAWQVYGNRNEGMENLVYWDEYYEKNRTVKLELKILLNTMLIMLTASHSDAILNYSLPRNSKQLKNLKAWLKIKNSCVKLLLSKVLS